MNQKTDITKFDRTWKLFWRYFGMHRYAIAALFFLMLLEIGLTLAIPQVVRTFISRMQERAFSPELMSIAVLFLVIVLFQISVRIFRSGLHNHLSWLATNALRYDLIAHVMSLDMRFHNTHTPGDLLERIDGDVKRLQSFFSELVPEISSAVILAAGTLAVLAFDDWQISLIFCIFLSTFVMIHRWDQRLAASFWEKERQYAAEVSSFVEERVSGIKDIHTSAAVEHTLDQFNTLLKRHALQSVKGEVVTDVGWGISGAFYAIGFALAMGLGGFLYFRGTVSLGVVYLVIQYLQLLWRPMTRIGGQLENLIRSQVSIRRITWLLNLQSSLTSGHGQLWQPGSPIAVDVEKVTFNYGQNDVLHDLSFSLKPGEKLGLLGRTGSGKSTLARLLFRFYDVEKGFIQYDGVDIRDYDMTSLRKGISLVTQDIQLLNAPIRDNITLYDSTISDPTIIRALQDLELGTWLDSLPDGLNTPLTSSGEGMSAGQAQLLAITRAFMKNPGLVILDEASSRVDPLTENLLDGAIQKLLENRTAVIIAHRLATVQKVDKVLLLENGQIREYGMYRQLIEDPDSSLSALIQTGSIEELS